jgi:hypothetical protein
MNAGSTRYSALSFSGGNWRVWDKDRKQWVGDLFPSYPDALLKDLNNSPTMDSYHEQASGEDRPRGLVRVAYIAVSGAVLGGYFAPWLLLPGPAGPGEAGCGNEVLGALLLGPPLGAFVGGLVGLAAGLLLNRAVYHMPSKPKPDATYSFSDQND